MGAACGAVAGAVFFGLLVSWTWYFGAVAYVPFVLLLSGWWALAGAAVGWLDRRGRAPAAVVAAVWVDRPRPEPPSPPRASRLPGSPWRGCS
jgi:hypothetical protein